MKLDLACGAQKVGAEYIGIDAAQDAKPDLCMDLLRFPWDFPDDAAETVHCSHFIEHIPAEDRLEGNGRRVDLLVRFFEEVYRVMSPGGMLTLRWPSPTAEPAFQDPTHRRFISRHFLAYLARPWRKEYVPQYDFRMDFQLLSDKVMMDEKIVKHKEGSRFAHYHFNAIIEVSAELQVVKPMRA